MACNGNLTEICGGPNRLDVYDFNNAIANLPTGTSMSSSVTASASSTGSAPPGWTTLGCYTDSVGARTLTTEMYSIPGTSMTVELCLAACLSSNFDLAGLEYAGECCESPFVNVQVTE